MRLLPQMANRCCLWGQTWLIIFLKIIKRICFNTLAKIPNTYNWFLTQTFLFLILSFDKWTCSHIANLNCCAAKEATSGWDKKDKLSLVQKVIIYSRSNGSQLLISTGQRLSPFCEALQHRYLTCTLLYLQCKPTFLSLLLWRKYILGYFYHFVSRKGLTRLAPLCSGTSAATLQLVSYWEIVAFAPNGKFKGKWIFLIFFMSHFHVSKDINTFFMSFVPHGKTEYIYIRE